MGASQTKEANSAEKKSLRWKRKNKHGEITDMKKNFEKQGRNSGHIKKESETKKIYIFGVPFMKIKKKKGAMIEEDFPETPIQEQSCNSATLSYNSELLAQGVESCKKFVSKGQMDIIINDRDRIGLVIPHARISQSSSFDVSCECKENDSITNKTKSCFSKSSNLPKASESVECENIRSVSEDSSSQNGFRNASYVYSSNKNMKNNSYNNCVKSNSVSNIPQKQTFALIQPLYSSESFQTFEAATHNSEQPTNVKSVHNLQDSLLEVTSTTTVFHETCSIDESHTELKIADTETKSDRYKIHDDKILELYHPLQSVKHLKDVEYRDEELSSGVDSHITDMKEFSSSYPNSSLQNSNGTHKLSALCVVSTYDTSNCSTNEDSIVSCNNFQKMCGFKINNYQHSKTEIAVETIDSTDKLDKKNNMIVHLNVAADKTISSEDKQKSNMNASTTENIPNVKEIPSTKVEKESQMNIVEIFKDELSCNMFCPSLSRISPSFGAMGGLCIINVTFLGWLYLYFSIKAFLKIENCSREINSNKCNLQSWTNTETGTEMVNNVVLFILMSYQAEVIDSDGSECIVNKSNEENIDKDHEINVVKSETEAECLTFELPTIEGDHRDSLPSGINGFLVKENKNERKGSECDLNLNTSVVTELPENEATVPFSNCLEMKKTESYYVGHLQDTVSDTVNSWDDAHELNKKECASNFATEDTLKLSKTIKTEYMPPERSSQYAHEHIYTCRPSSGEEEYCGNFNEFQSKTKTVQVKAPMSHVQIGSTKRLTKDSNNGYQEQILSESELGSSTENGKLKQKLRSNSFYSRGSDKISHIAANEHRRKSKRKRQSLRKKRWFQKIKNKSNNVTDYTYSKKDDYWMKDSEIMSVIDSFCHKCHQQKQKANNHCSQCRLLMGELGTEKFQYKVISKEDSGISSLLSSIRSSILSEFKQYQSLSSSKGRSKTRKKSLKRLLKLGFLEHELRKVTKDVNIDNFGNNGHSAIVLPGLQSYFDSLRNGVTPSLQERMAYEWLRLLSFSSYTGGGCPVHLARSGFYHHHGNETHCFSCNVSYSDWNYTDNVEEIHRRISPNCPFIVGGMASNGNISIEAGREENQSRQPSQNLTNVSHDPLVPSPASGSTDRQAANLPPSNGIFSFRPSWETNPGDQSTTTGVGVSEVPRFSFYPSTAGTNASVFGFSQNTSQQQMGGNDAAAQIMNQLGALTIQQQSSGIQQPTEEQPSTNPFIVPTQSLQITRSTGGDAQLSVSAQQQPEANSRQQNSTGNQAVSGSSSGSSGGSSARTESADILQLGNLKHPRYRTMAVRMSSFASWPSYLNQTPEQMAYAGFFHPGVADFARCFCCGGGLRNWEADDDPMVEHARWYPRCEYINRLKGTHYVQAVLRRHRQHMAETQREQETVQNTFATPDPMTTTVAASLLEMGFTEERAREAILTVRRLRGRAEVTAEEVTAWMLDDETAPRSEPAHTQTAITTGPREPVRQDSEPEPQTTVSTTTGSSGTSESTSVTQRPTSDSLGSDTQGATGGVDTQVEAKGKDEKSRSRKNRSPQDKKSKLGKGKSSTEAKKDESAPGEKSNTRKDKSPPSEGASLLQHGEVDTKSLKEENKLLKEMQVCKICMDKYVSVTFLPCGHLVCCENCARSMRKCPICRKRIKGQVKTFMS